MKAFLGFMIPICVFSFIAFGVSVAVLGINQTTSSDVSAMDEYTELSEEYSRIELNATTGDVSIYPNSSDKTVICVSEGMKKAVSAEISGGTLYIDIGTYQDISTFWESLFGGASRSVEIYVPDRIYDSVVAEANAGNTMINGVAASSVSLDLNAGNLTYAGVDGYRPNVLNVYVNAGNCTLYNAQTNAYDIHMGAGNIDVYGLTGSGSVEVSAGNGDINYAQLDGNIDVQTSAGNLDLNLPAGASAVIECVKSAGDVDVEYGDINEDLDDGDSVKIREGDYNIHVEVSAGDVEITDDLDIEKAPRPLDPPKKPADRAEVTTMVQATAASDVTVVDLDEAESVPVVEEVQ